MVVFCLFRVVLCLFVNDLITTEYRAVKTTWLTPRTKIETTNIKLKVSN